MVDIEEGYTKGSVNFISKAKTELILEQMKKCICQVDGNKIGTGFFCKILYKDELIPVLITNYHIIDDNFLKSKEQLNIFIDQKKICKKISLKKDRKIYSSKREDNDIMILKLKEEDGINNYLELDANLFNKDSEISYENSSIYILHYPNADEVSVSYGYGLIKDNHNNFQHKCHTQFGSSGGPILNLSTNKVIGIHLEARQDKNKNVMYNIGKLLKLPLYELNEENKKIKDNNEYEIKDNLTNINMNNNNFNNSTNLINKIQDEFSFSCYTKAPKTGLKNLGDTSYLNAVLQLLAISKYLSSYFINPKNTKYFTDNVGNSPITFVIHRLFLHFYPYPEKNKQEIYNPETLLAIFGRKNILYNSKDGRNPNELILFILNALHREINSSKILYFFNCGNTSKEKEIEEFNINYMKSNKSIISLNFHWFEMNSQKCSGCQNHFYHIKEYETLELDIDGYISKSNNFPLSIARCLDFQCTKIQKLLCKNCKTYNDMDIFTNIYSAPNYFIFSLYRENKKNNLMGVPFFIENNIDLSPFIENKQSLTKFELQGIVSISLKENNKYVCFGKSPIDNQWYLYNDENVSNDELDNILNLHNNNNPNYVSCILLYKGVAK